MTSRHGTVSPAAKGDTGRVKAHWQVSRGKALPPRPGNMGNAAATWDFAWHRRGKRAPAAPGLRGVVQGAIHLTLELNQWPVLFGLRATLGTISVARLYAHVLAIVDEPQTPALEQKP